MPINKLSTIDEAFELKLQELYDIETQIEKALRKMIKKATTEDLKAGFTKHHEETEGQIVRLEEAFLILELIPKKARSEGIRGILIDGENVAVVIAEPELKDSLLASAARSVEHFEMSYYLSAIALGELLEQSKIVSLLQASLAEEMATDETLAALSATLAEAAKTHQPEE